MTGPKYLFNASSIVRALKEARLVSLGGQAIQWLTVYEVLNAVWKEAHLLGRLSPDEAASLASIFASLAGEMVILKPEGVEGEILQLALPKGLTVYDASYIALALRHGLTLVTEDRKLAHAASSIVGLVSLDDL